MKNDHDKQMLIKDMKNDHEQLQPAFNMTTFMHAVGAPTPAPPLVQLCLPSLFMSVGGGHGRTVSSIPSCLPCSHSGCAWSSFLGPRCFLALMMSTAQHTSSIPYSSSILPAAVQVMMISSMARSASGSFILSFLIAS